MDFSVSLRTVIPLLALMGAGLLSRRLGFLKAGDERVLNAYVYYFALPALFVVDLSETRLTGENLRFVAAGLIPTLVIAVLFWAAWRVLRFTRSTLHLLIVSTVFGSLAFFGLPFVMFAFPDAGMRGTAVGSVGLIHFCRLEALGKIKELVHTLRGHNIPIRYIDIGGGLGITYDQEQPPHPRDYAAALMGEMHDLNCTLILEPGRVIAGNAGILVTRVLYIKEGSEKNFVTVDAAMNDLIRPSLYGAFQAIQAVVKAADGEMVADVVGPICESGDFFAKERTLPRVKPDDLLAIMSAGAYGFTMSSNYNSRPRVPEVMVRGTEFYLTRRREQYEDLIRGESIPEWLDLAKDR